LGSDVVGSNGQGRDEAIDALIATGITREELFNTIAARAEAANRAAQAQLAPPTPQGQAAWLARKAWLLDGEPIYGELKEFFFPALLALQADDQAEYSRKRDLLFKALRTFLGDPPPAA
jgi:hypothetical protein